MDTFLSTLKKLLCMRPQSQVSTPPLLGDACAGGAVDLEMQPLFCDEPRDTSPLLAAPELGPEEEESRPVARAETWDAVYAQDFYCTPVMFQARQPAPRLHAKFLQRARASLPGRSYLSMALNPDLLESTAWRLRASDRSKEMSNSFEQHDVLRIWGYAGATLAPSTPTHAHTTVQETIDRPEIVDRPERASGEGRPTDRSPEIVDRPC